MKGFTSPTDFTRTVRCAFLAASALIALALVGPTGSAQAAPAGRNADQVFVRVQVRQRPLMLGSATRRASTGWNRVSRRAARSARRSPFAKTRREAQVATLIERRRAKAIGRFAAAMAPNVTAQAKIARLIDELGGSMPPAEGGIGVIGAWIPKSALAALASDPNVVRVSRDAPTLAMGAMDADTWHANGLTEIGRASCRGRV